MLDTPKLACENYVSAKCQMFISSEKLINFVTTGIQVGSFIYLFFFILLLLFVLMWTAWIYFVMSNAIFITTGI